MVQNNLLAVSWNRSCVLIANFCSTLIAHSHSPNFDVVNYYYGCATKVSQTARRNSAAAEVWCRKMPPLENPPSPKNAEEPPERSPFEAFPTPPASAVPVEKDSTSDSTKKPNSSPFNLLDLYKKVSDTVKTVATELPSGFAPASDLLPDNDAEAKKATDTVSKASQGVKHADSHEAAYLAMLHRGENKKLEPGDYKKEDGSSYKVNQHGKINEFTTAATKESPSKTYKDIIYDTNGEMISYVASSDDGTKSYKFSRIQRQDQRLTQNDKDGFATWMVRDNNTQAQLGYTAAGGAQYWRGKSVVDENGFHTMVDRTPRNSAPVYNMHTKASDGTTVESTSPMRDRQGLIMQTKVSLPDSTEVTRNARVVRNDSWVRDSTGRATLQHNDKVVINPHVKVVDAKETEATRVKMDASGTSGDITDTTKIGLKVSPEAQQVADKVLKKITDSPDPIKDLAKAYDGLKNLRTFTMTKTENGAQNVDVNFNHATMQPAIRANVNGFTPGPSRIDSHVSFTLSNTQQGVNIDNIQGITGTASRRRTVPTWTNSMHFRPGAVDVGSTALGPMGRRYHSSNNTFGPENFHPGTPMRNLVEQPEALRSMAGALRMFQSTEDVNQITLRKNKEGGFDLATHGRDSKHIPINHKIEEKGVTINSLDLAKDLSASMSADAKGARLKDIKGVSLKVTTVFGESVLTPREVALETNKDGKPVITMKLEHPQLKGEYLPVEIPISELKEMLAGKTKTVAPKPGVDTSKPVKPPVAEPPAPIGAPPNTAREREVPASSSARPDQVRPGETAKLRESVASDQAANAGSGDKDWSKSVSDLTKTKGRILKAFMDGNEDDRKEAFNKLVREVFDEAYLAGAKNGGQEGGEGASKEAFKQLNEYFKNEKTAYSVHLDYFDQQARIGMSDAKTGYSFMYPTADLERLRKEAKEK